MKKTLYLSDSSAYSAKGSVMDADRTNHNMVKLAETAFSMATRQSRLAAVEYLFCQGCSPESIARILAQYQMPPSTGENFAILGA